MLERDKDQRVDRLTASFLTRFTKVFLWLFIVMLYAHTISALDKLGTALLTCVSIASVVIGLAAQSTLANPVADIALVFYTPSRVNDKLEVAWHRARDRGKRVVGLHAAHRYIEEIVVSAPRCPDVSAYDSDLIFCAAAGSPAGTGSA